MNCLNILFMVVFWYVLPFVAIQLSFFFTDLASQGKHVYVPKSIVTEAEEFAKVRFMFVLCV